jgi:hypothetical protein
MRVVLYSIFLYHYTLSEFFARNLHLIRAVLLRGLAVIHAHVHDGGRVLDLVTRNVLDNLNVVLLRVPPTCSGDLHLLQEGILELIVLLLLLDLLML